MTGQAPGSAAPFFRGVVFGLVGALALWALIGLAWWLA